ncbi:isocitrate lyase/PEP mutase family protein [Azospirillum canadense]|uniref:isocitrate lyase/PEP mutase family protein n=1 Tax=Azospirillum canadense TaxID=403962 RepID=UPI0022263CAD|nr:isocitrate lyase/PEP mutase family protein [Azospirillum canadense]MCW2241102.1 methylisocitrate lyase [Azospirillum canadense]
MSVRGPEFRNRVLAQKTVWSAGAYDALSARFIEAAGFDALMTSGFGVSASFLGQPDAELYTMSENLTVVRNVVSAVKVPVIADIDTGYGNAINVMRTIREFEAAGVSAVIMEDQVAPKRCPICVGGVEVIPMDEGIAKIEAAVAARRDPNMLIIARTDVVDPAAAMERGRAYVAAGADMIQPISKCFKDIDGLRAMREACGVPLSLQLLGWLERLSAAEVEEVAGMATYALVPLMTVTAALKENLAALAERRSTRDLPRPVTDHNQFVDFIGFPEIEELQKRYLKTA